MAFADYMKIASLSSPVLCFDTCTALDLMRDPTRETVTAHERQSAVDILSAKENFGHVTLLMAEQVQQEFSENADGVEYEAERALSKLQSQIDRIDEIAAIYGSRGRSNLGHLRDHIRLARQFASRWIDSALLVKEGPEIHTQAIRRMREQRSPSRKGKDSIKDCIVIETYLDFSRKLRAAGSTVPIVFATSNTRDYSDQISRKPRADIAQEFSELRIEFASSLSSAKHFLNIVNCSY